MLRTLKRLARRVLRPPLHTPEVKLDYQVLGTEYGGWPLLSHQTPEKPLIFSFGVGEDLSFDLAAIASRKATVFAFDPTPRSIKWIEQQTLPEALHFNPVGIAAEDGEMQFFAPEVDEYVSFSATPAAGSKPELAVKAPVKRLNTLINELSVGIPDVLKMDIEGFEYDVLEDLIVTGKRPAQLLIEFHHRMYGIENSRTTKQIERLRSVGYKIFYVSEGGHEYGLVHQSALT